MDNIKKRVSSAIGLHSPQERSTGFIDEKNQFQKPLAIEKNRVSEDESVNNPA